MTTEEEKDTIYYVYRNPVWTNDQETMSKPQVFVDGEEKYPFQKYHYTLTTEDLGDEINNPHRTKFGEIPSTSESKINYAMIWPKSGRVLLMTQLMGISEFGVVVLAPGEDSMEVVWERYFTEITKAERAYRRQEKHQRRMRP